MQLCYRGIAYETQYPEVKMIETNQVGSFLGSRFKVRQVNVPQRYRVPQQLTYRGVHYQQ